MVELKHMYPQITNGKTISYGGNQMLSPRELIRKCGCGPVAALDTLLYLEGKGRMDPIPVNEYQAMLSGLVPRYFPLLAPLGINEALFVLGLNRLLKDRNLPLRASLAFSDSKLWARVECMLSQDTPAILAIGNNFPAFWQSNRLPFYVKMPDGLYQKRSAAKAHFVVATGLDESWLRIASWGKEYYINKNEFDFYRREHSNSLLCNVVNLRKSE